MFIHSSNFSSHVHPCSSTFSGAFIHMFIYPSIKSKWWSLWWPKVASLYTELFGMMILLNWRFDLWNLWDVFTITLCCFAWDPKRKTQHSPVAKSAFKWFHLGLPWKNHPDAFQKIEVIGRFNWIPTLVTSYWYHAFILLKISIPLCLMKSTLSSDFLLPHCTCSILGIIVVARTYLDVSHALSTGHIYLYMSYNATNPMVFPQYNLTFPI